MPEKSAEHSKFVSGNFFASFVHPKTGKRIFAKDYGKKAFFIPVVQNSDVPPKKEASE